MQMRKMYQSTDKRKRAADARKAAIECEQAGVKGLAQLNWEIAAWLDPYHDRMD